MSDNDIDDLRRQLEQSQAEIARLRKALTVVANWDLPEYSGQKFLGFSMSYEAAHGSNGVRAYLQKVAREALAAMPEDGIEPVQAATNTVNTATIERPAEATYEKIPIDEFNKLASTAVWREGPVVSTFGDAYGQPYQPHRRVWGTLADGRRVESVIKAK